MALTSLTKLSQFALSNSISFGSTTANDYPTPNGSTLDRTKLGAVTVSDNFTNSALYDWVIPDNTAWPAYITNTPWHGNFGSAAFSQPGDGTHGITIAEPTYGGLKLSLYQDAGKANTWYCGSICSLDTNGNGFAAADGYWQITAKLPTPPNANGAWCAFWLSSYLPTATYGTYVGTELDVFEWYGAWANGIHGSYHLWNGSSGDIFPYNSDTTFWIATPPLNLSNTALSDTFHNHGCLVTNNFVRYYMDDIQTVFYQRSSYTDSPFGFLIDIAGGGAGGAQPTIDGSGSKDMYVTNFSYSPLK